MIFGRRKKPGPHPGIPNTFAHVGALAAREKAANAAREADAEEWIKEVRATALYLSAETRDAVRFAEEQVDVVYDLAIIERMLKRKPVFAVPCQDCEWKKGHP